MAGRWFFFALCMGSLAGFAGAGSLAHAQTPFAQTSAAQIPSAQTAQAAAPAIATGMRLAGDDKSTRFIMDLSRKLDMRVFTLSNPYRVVIDLPQTVFQFPPNADEGGRGLVKAYRYGLVMAGGSRIVLDVTGPVRLDKAFVLDAQDDQPVRLVLDLAATDHDSFMRALAAQANAGFAEPRRMEQAGDKIKRHLLADKNDPRPLIVIDPGHGGPDTGAKTADEKIMEKDMVLDFSKTLRERLEKSGRYRVMLTRIDDSFIPLGERVKIARMNEAALFMSIHADSLPRLESGVQGATIYTLSDKPSDTEAARLADLENRSDIVAGVDMSKEPNEVVDILIDLAQRETRAHSQQFAGMLAGEMKNKIRLHKQPLKSAGFVVLKAPDIPSVLVELGYMSNQQDLKLLVSKDWHGKAADSIAEAVDAFFRTRLAGTDAAPKIRQ